MSSSQITFSIQNDVGLGKLCLHSAVQSVLVCFSIDSRIVAWCKQVLSGHFSLCTHFLEGMKHASSARCESKSCLIATFLVIFGVRMIILFIVKMKILQVVEWSYTSSQLCWLLQVERLINCDHGVQSLSNTCYFGLRSQIYTQSLVAKMYVSIWWDTELGPSTLYHDTLWKIWEAHEMLDFMV